MMLVNIYLYKLNQDHTIPLDLCTPTLKGRFGFKVVFPPSASTTVDFYIFQIIISSVLLVKRPNRL